MQHIIKKQRIDLHVNHGLDSFSIQQKLNDQYWAFILPLLDDIFEGLSEENEVISLESLIIDLGSYSLNDLETMNSNSKLIESIKSQIVDQVIKERSLNPSSNIKSKVLSDYDQWFFYMINGYLNWNVISEQAHWNEHVLEILASDYNMLIQFIDAVENHENFLVRMVRQHDVTFLSRLIQIIAPNYCAEIIKKIRELNIYLSGTKSIKTSDINRNMELFWVEMIKSVARLEKSNSRKSNHHIFEHIILENITSMVFPEFQSSKSESSFIQNEQEQAMFIQNVGLILLHPFMGSLFNRLELIQKKEFVNQEAQEKAVFLLHFAATGKVKAKEYELVIPKILCGFPMEYPISNEIYLSTEEKEEVEMMLNACISNWDILKNTSADGLREGFLQRKGKVVISFDKIIVQVEKGPIDMLLDHLPWSISLIKFLWINQIIHVEWR